MNMISKLINQFVLILVFIFFLTMNVYSQEKDRKSKPDRASDSLKQARKLPKFIEWPIISISGFYGILLGRNEDAIEDFKLTELADGNSYEGSITIYPNRAGAGFELTVGHNSRKLSESGVIYGSLEMTPIISRLKVHTFPNSSFGLGFHMAIGIGLSINNFKKSNTILAFEEQLGGELKIETNSNLVLDMGLGFDIFFTRHVSFGANALYQFGNVGTSWSLVTQNGTADISDIETFTAGGFQFTGGLNFYY